MSARLRSHLKGFTLVEALIALLVASAGLLGMARLQVALSQGASETHQQAEAQALVRSQLEAVRRLQTRELPEQGNGSRQVTGSSGAKFDLRWTTTMVDNPKLPLTTVQVDWKDSRGKAQQVLTSAAITRPEASAAAAMANPLQGRQEIRGAVNRNVDVPLFADNFPRSGYSSLIVRPLLDTTGLLSPISLSVGPAVTFIIENATSKVVLRCLRTPSESELSAGRVPLGCERYNAVVLAGFINDANNLAQLGLGSLLAAGVTLYPQGISVTSISGWDNSNGKRIECEYGPAPTRNADLQAGAAVSSVNAYTCVIPLASGGAWGGKFQFSGLIPLTLRASSICRYEYPDPPNTDSNRRNRQSYQGVTGSLFNQNYHFVASDRCPTHNDLATTKHQACPPALLSLLGILLNGNACVPA